MVGEVGQREDLGDGAFRSGEEDEAEGTGVGDGYDPFDEPGVADFDEAVGVGFEFFANAALVELDAFIKPLVLHEGAGRGEVEGSGGWQVCP